MSQPDISYQIYDYLANSLKLNVKSSVRGYESKYQYIEIELSIRNPYTDERDVLASDTVSIDLPN